MQLSHVASTKSLRNNAYAHGPPDRENVEKLRIGSFLCRYGMDAFFLDAKLK